jgi:hypothetical protein
MWCCWCSRLGLRGSVASVDGEAERRRSLSSPALRGTMLGCGRAKLDGSVSYRESRWCSRSATLGMGSGVGGCRQWPEGAAEVRRGAALGERKCHGIEVLG